MNEDDSKTEIMVNISISSIDGFNEIDMTFRIKFRLSIQWKVSSDLYYNKLFWYF